MNIGAMHEMFLPSLFSWCYLLGTFSFRPQRQSDFKPINESGLLVKYTDYGLDDLFFQQAVAPFNMHGALATAHLQLERCTYEPP